MINFKRNSAITTIKVLLFAIILVGVTSYVLSRVIIEERVSAQVFGIETNGDPSYTTNISDVDGEGPSNNITITNGDPSYTTNISDVDA